MWTKRNTAIGVALLLFAVGIAMLGFPLGMDQGMFVHGARTLLSGGTLYRDVLEVKPPLIHELYALAILLPLPVDVAVRVFDIAWLTATCFLIFVAMRPLQVVWRYLGLGLFVAILLASSYQNTAQPETFAALPLALLVLLHARKCSWHRNTLQGISLGMLIALKPSLVLVVPLVLVLVVRRRLNAIWSASVVAVSLVATVLLCVLPVLLRPDGIQALRDLLAFQSAFAGLDIHLGAWVSHGLSQTAWWFTFASGLPVVAVAAWAGYTRRSQPLVFMLNWLFLVLFASIVLEHRFHPYHFLRLLIPLIILFGFGTALAAALFKRYWSLGSLRYRATAIAVTVVLCTATCLPRTVHKLGLGYGQLFGFHSFDTYMAARGNSGDNHMAYRRVAYAINSVNTKHTIIFSIRAGLVTPWLNQWNNTRASSTHFVISHVVPPEWKRLICDDIQRAAVVAIDTADATPALTGHNQSSYRWLRNHRCGSEFTLSHFAVIDTVETFLILSRVQ